MSGFVAIMMIGFALSMDAFAVSLGIGVQKLYRQQVLFIGLLVGFFHVWLPLAGMWLGGLLTDKFTSIAKMGSGALLLTIGFYMLYASLFEKEKSATVPTGIGLFLFAFGVSIDSFSVGVSLGLFGLKMIAAVAVFGLFSMCASWLGLLAGRKLHGLLGLYGKFLGSFILIGFGIKIIFY